MHCYCETQRRGVNGGGGVLVVLTALADTITRGKTKSKIKFVPVIWH